MRIVFTCYLIFLTFLSQAQVQPVLQKYYEFTGDKEAISGIHSLSVKGKIEIKAMNLVIPFQYQKAGNQSRFEQMALRQGMDLMPAIIRLVNNQGWIIIDETPMNMGYNITQLKEKALQLWRESEQVFPFTVDNYMALDGTFSPAKKDENGLNKVEATLPSGQISSLYFNKKGQLIRHDFETWHMQLGKIAISREYRNYKEKEGFRYPTEWTDRRKGLELFYTIDEVLFNPVIKESIFQLPTQKEEKKFTKKQVKKLIDLYISLLNESSPFESSVEKIKNALPQKLDQAWIDQISSSSALAEKLSDEIIEITGDHHFGITYNPDLFEELMPKAETTMIDDSYWTKRKKFEAENNYFFDQYGKKGKFFYFHLSQFGELEYAKDFFDSLMQEATKAKGLIIDLRNNSGGTGRMARYMASYFLPENTLLYTSISSEKEEKVYSVKTPTNKQLQNMPLYILVNAYTGSAGEHLPYLMQNHDRATVIGESTYGAAHPSYDEPLIDGFVGFIPFAYEKHIKTGKDWEGTGVKPDVECKSDEALDMALKLRKN